MFIIYQHVYHFIFPSWIFAQVISLSFFLLLFCANGLLCDSRFFNCEYARFYLNCFPQFFTGFKRTFHWWWFEKKKLKNILLSLVWCGVHSVWRYKSDEVFVAYVATIRNHFECDAYGWKMNENKICVCSWLTTHVD